MMAWFARGLLIVFCLLVATTAALAQTVGGGPPLAALVSWGGVVACAGLVAEWAVRGAHVKDLRRAREKDDMRREELQEAVANCIPRDELREVLERVEDRVDKRFDRIEQSLGVLFDRLTPRQEKS